MFSVSAYELRGISSQATLLDLYLFVFGGLPHHSSSIWLVLRWVLVYGFSLYLAGEVLDRDFKENRLYLLIRIKSRFFYVLSKLISLFAFVCFYALLGYLLAFVYGFLFFENKLSLSNDFIETFNMFGFSLNLGSIIALTILGLFCICAMLLLLVISFERLRNSFVYVVAILFFNAKFLTGTNELENYNFLNRAMGYRYIYSERDGNLYSLSSSLLCLSIFILLFSFISALVFRRKDRII